MDKILGIRSSRRTHDAQLGAAFLALVAEIPLDLFFIQVAFAAAAAAVGLGRMIVILLLSFSHVSKQSSRL